jgi:hypothetical protein
MTTTAPAPPRTGRRFWLIIAGLFVVGGAIAVTMMALREGGGVRWSLVSPGAGGFSSGPIVAEVAPELAAEGIKCDDVGLSAEVSQIAFVRHEIYRITFRLSRRDQAMPLDGLRYTLLDAGGQPLSDNRLDRQRPRQAANGTIIEIQDPFVPDARKILVHR